MYEGVCEIETDEVEYKWTITQFSKVKTRLETDLTKLQSVQIYSSDFYSKLSNTNKKWHLGLEYLKDDNFKIKLIFEYRGYSRFTVQFFILNNEKEEEKLSDIVKLHFNPNDNYSFPIDVKYLKDEKYINNDTLTIICKLVEYDYPSTRSLPSLEVGPKSLSKDISNLLTSEEYSDATLIVNATEFKVHKMILIARSPVFAAMFSHKDFKESQRNQVVIKDTSAQAMKTFLEFIYTDTIEKLDEERFDLWKLADKYQIETLKNYCERIIYYRVNKECVLEVLQFATSYDIKNLLDKTLSYFLINCKSMILENEEWKTLTKTNPILFDLILDCLKRNNSY